MLLCKLLGLSILILIANLVSSGKPKGKAVKTAETGVVNLGLIFSLAQQGLGSYDKGKYPKLDYLSKKSARIAMALGSLGAVFSIVMAFLPAEDSPELKYMKSEFPKLTEKIDTIAKSLADTKGLIASSTQQAAYIAYEHKIMEGFSKLRECMERVDNVVCSNQTDCRRQKTSVAQGYISYMKVRPDMDSLFRGAVSDNIFGRSLLDLLKEESKCDIPKINLLSDKIVSLLVEGTSVSMYHDILLKSHYNILDDTRNLEKMLRQLEMKRSYIEDSCIRNINNWLSFDVKKAQSDFSADVQNTNSILFHKLKKKYPYTDIHVFTFSGDDKPVAGPSDSPRRHFKTSSKTQKMRAFVVPTNNATVEDLPGKIQKWKELLQQVEFSGKLSSQIQTIEQKVKDNPALDGQVQSFAILKGNKWVLGYHNGTEIQQHTLGSFEVNSMNVFVNRPRQSEGFLVVVSFYPEDFPFKCSDVNTCSGQGQCYTYPYSREMSCKCNVGYSGERCNNSETDLGLQSLIDSLLNNTLQLPTFASIQHALEDLHVSLKSSSENIKDSIAFLEAKVDEEIRKFGEFMSDKFEWHKIQVKYRNAIDNVQYFYTISNSKNRHEALYSTQSKNLNFKRLPAYTHEALYPTQSKNFNSKRLPAYVSVNELSSLEEKDTSTFLLNPTGIQLWMYQINYLIVGRRDSQFNAHKSFLFIVMDKYKDRLCTQDYKDTVIRTYRQLMLLQFQGFILWSKAYSSENLDSSALARQYQDVLKQQKDYIQQAICSVNIPHSKNLQNCIGDGYLNYIHNTMDILPSCHDGYFVQGR